MTNKFQKTITKLQINSNTEIPNRWERVFLGIVIYLSFGFCFLEFICHL